MSISFVKYALIGCLVSLGFHTSSYSQDSEQKWSQKAGRTVSKAIRFANSGKHQDALEKYEKLLKSAELSAFETSTIYQLKGQSEYYLGSYDMTIGSFRKAISAGGLDEGVVENLEKNIEDLEKIILRNNTEENISEDVKRPGSFSITPRSQNLKPKQ